MYLQQCSATGWRRGRGGRRDRGIDAGVSLAPAGCARRGGLALLADADTDAEPGRLVR